MGGRGTGRPGPEPGEADGRRTPHESEIVDRRWRVDLRSALLCAGCFLGLLLLVDAAAGTLTVARAVLWGGLTLLLFVVLVPPRVTAGEGWPAVGTLTGTRRVRTDRLVIARSTGDRLGDDAGPLDSTPQGSADLVYRQLRRDLINVEVSELHRLYDEHRISDTTRRRLQRSLDLEEARLADA